MSRGFTLKDIEERLKAGTIAGFVDERKNGKGTKNIPATKRGQKIKDWIALNLKYWCMANGLELKEEVKFHPERKWRFDWGIMELKVGIEYNGIMSQKSRHTTVTGYSGDMEKINAAQAMGWKVFQYTPINHKDLLKDLNKLL